MRVRPWGLAGYDLDILYVEHRHRMGAFHYVSEEGYIFLCGSRRGCPEYRGSLLKIK